MYRRVSGLVFVLILLILNFRLESAYPFFFFPASAVHFRGCMEYGFLELFCFVLFRSGLVWFDLFWAYFSVACCTCIAYLADFIHSFKSLYLLIDAIGYEYLIS